MPSESNPNKAIDILRQRFPDLSEEELIAANERFGRYLEMTVRLYETIRNDPERYKKLQEAIAQKNPEFYNLPLPPL